MEFTYQAYRDLLSLLREGGYAFRNYHDYKDEPRCVILRHDIDNSLSQAVRLAELEAEEGEYAPPGLSCCGQTSTIPPPGNA